MTFMMLLSLYSTSCSGKGKADEVSSPESAASAPMKELNASDIIKKIKQGKPVQLINCMIWDDLDFTLCGDPRVTSGIAVEVDVETPIYFHHCLFMGKVLGKSKYQDKFSCSTNFRRSVTFSNCEFRDEVDFTKVVVCDNIDFSKSIFGEDAKFDLLEIRGGMNRFYEIKAEKGFSFASSYCSGNLSFMDAEFKGEANFHKLICAELMMNNVSVEGDAIFSNMTIRGSGQFNHTRFGHDFDMSYSKFLGPLIMCHAEIGNKITLNHCIFNSPSRFSNSSTYEMDMNESLFFFAPDLTNVRIKKVTGGKSIYRFMASEKHVFSLAADDPTDNDSTTKFNNATLESGNSVNNNVINVGKNKKTK